METSRHKFEEIENKLEKEYLDSLEDVDHERIRKIRLGIIDANGEPYED